MFPGLGPYVYLRVLEDDYPNEISAISAYTTFNPSTAVINDRHHNIEPITNAINTLKRIAASEETKEKLAIENYLSKLNKALSPSENNLPESLRANLQKQVEQLNKLDFSDMEKKQYSLIHGINIIRQNINSYRRRLNEITNQKKSLKMNKRFEYNIQKNVEQFLRNQSDSAQVTFTNPASRIKRDRMLKKKFDEMIKSNSLFNGLSSNLSQELYSILFVDFSNWVENISSTQKSYQSISMRSDKALNSLFSEYEKSMNIEGEQTHIYSLLKDNTDAFNALLNDMNKSFHGTYFTKEQYQELQELVAQAERDKKNEIKMKDKTKYTLKQAQDFIKTYNDQIEVNEDKTFAFTLHSRTSHGNFYEIVSSIISSAINVRGNVAADLIAPIATLVFTRNEQEAQKLLLQLSQNLGNLISNHFDEQKKYTIENFDQHIAGQRVLSKHIQENLSKVEEDLSDIEKTQKEFFIAHESLKLYGSLESNSQEISEFHGRHMAILPVLTKLYASPLIANNMIEHNKLITYLLNIDSATIAHNQQPLETYLSLFAGLLMFDDIEEIATLYTKEITDNISPSTISCLHVYNVNGVYLPISVILNNLIEQLENVNNDLSKINNSNTATASLEGKLPKITNEMSTLDDWKQFANDTIKNTKIQINFLSGFTDYIEKLFNNFK